MTNFMIGFNAVMPVLLYILIGQLIHRIGWMSRKSLSEMNKALFAFFLPLNLFNNVYHMDLDKNFNPRTLAFVIIYAIAIFIVYALIIPIFQKRNDRRGVMLQGSIRSNAILFGLPLGTALLGKENLGMVSIALAIIVPVNNILSVIALSIYTDEDFSFKDLMHKIISNPMVIATASGIVIAALGLRLPQSAEVAFDNLSAMTSPLALTVMGGLFKFDKIKDADWSLYFTVINKLLVNPAIALSLAVLFGLRDDNIISVLIATAGPTAVSSYAQAVMAGGDEDLANQIVVFTTCFAMFTLVFWIWLLKSLALF